MQVDGATASPSWIAAGLSSGSCRLLDARSGNLVASWRAHDGYITKVCLRIDKETTCIAVELITYPLMCAVGFKRGSFACVQLS